MGTSDASREWGRPEAADTVRLERLLPGPLERVWRYLVDPELRGRWLASGPMELRPGGAVELRFLHANLSPVKEPTPARFRAMESGVAVPGRITRCEPPTLLAHTWAEESGEDSEVTFELSEEGNRVRLVVTHRRLATHAARVDVASGWHAHLDILIDELEGRERRPFWSHHARLEEEYERRLSGES